MKDPFASQDPAPAPAAPAPCPNCSRPMQVLPLKGHYGRSVVVDLCRPCRLVWFDTLESVNLSSHAWITLLRELQRATPSEHPWSGRALACPRCSAPLVPVHNLSRFGRFAANECTHRHGHQQSFVLLLAERGLVRPLAWAERTALARLHKPLACLNCGAHLDGAAAHCGHCQSPLVVIDMPRLAAALSTDPGTPLPVPDGRLMAWHCAGCGRALDPVRRTDCAHCGQLIVMPTLDDLVPLLDACEAAWWARQQPPARERPARSPRLEPGWRDTSLARLLHQVGMHTPHAPHWWLAAAAVTLAGWLLLQ